MPDNNFTISLPAGRISGYLISMKKAAIVSIGNELLSGEVVDTNAAYLSERLLSVGVGTAAVHVAGDSLPDIVKALERASEDGDIVLVTGGLGPTDDDLTRQGFGEFLGVELEFRQELLDRMETFFTRRNYIMPEKNRIQAYIPRGSTALLNELGTAAGFVIVREGKLFASMPGVPREMKEMFERSVMGLLEGFAAGQVVLTRRLRCFGAGESSIAEMLGDLMSRERNPLINCTVDGGIITLHIVASAMSREQAVKMVEADEKILRGILGKLVFGVDEQTLSEVVGKKLAERGLSIVTAESCTGGLLGKTITDVPGASRYFKQGWVTYCNEAKIRELGVDRKLIEKHGAVSKEVAEAMAKGAAEQGGADISVGITGIAGPEGASEQKPVGLVYIAVKSDKGCMVRRFVFSSDRQITRLRAAQTALNMVREIL
ncbi:MAG: competence/damage-inducible protein A [Planctomycetota bacterium]